MGETGDGKRKTRVENGCVDEHLARKEKKCERQKAGKSCHARTLRWEFVLGMPTTMAALLSTSMGISPKCVIGHIHAGNMAAVGSPSELRPAGL
jgi:hypothetical protein